MAAATRHAAGRQGATTALLLGWVAVLAAQPAPPAVAGTGAAAAMAAASAAASASAPAAANAARRLPPAQRKAVLDAVRPPAARQVGQAVRIRVARLNIDGDQALLWGALVAPGGGTLAWNGVAGCPAGLDKNLWALLQRHAGRWQVRSLQVCAPEPPWWGLDAATLRAWPCGLFDGLVGPEGQDLHAVCLQRPALPAGTAPAPTGTR